MEETVGKFWHRWITRAAGGSDPEAAVRLREVERIAAVLFRALGGDPGLRVAAATEDEHGARRNWLTRLAGAGERAAQARMDAATLRLPPEIDAFADAALNRELYLWLAALAAAHSTLAFDPAEHDFQRNQRATLAALEQWPGLETRYLRLAGACIAARPVLESLPPAEAARERAIRAAIMQHGSIDALPAMPEGTPPPQPVLLWLTGTLDASIALRGANDPPPQDAEIRPRHDEDARRQAHRAKREDMPQNRNSFAMMFRVESVMAVAEFLKMNRPTDDEPDDDAARAARDLDHLSLAPDEAPVASKVRFDLDLPSEAEDDVVLGEGVALPEWDYRKQRLLEDHVRLVEMRARDATPAPLPPNLRRTARRLHQQFAALQPGRCWLRQRPEGTEADVDANVRARTDRITGRQASENLYRSLEKRERDLACLVLADLSLSTDTWVSSQARVIDVIRDALLLFGEALLATGDRFAMCGFSSVRRKMVRFHHLKGFDERFDDAARGRIQAVRPGYYTRLGAAIRHATQLLADTAASRRILLILSDGKPNDLDLYEGRYGIEDSRAAIVAARRAGLVPFCVTIDTEGGGYLPHLFGPAGYIVIRKPEELPARLPTLYAQLTR
jgi:nitric oxide reductase NorD protein